MRYLILLLALSACSPDMSKHDTTVNNPPKEEQPLPVPPPEEQPPEEPAPPANPPETPEEPKKTCVASFYWNFYHPYATLQILEYKDSKHYKQIRMSPAIQNYDVTSDYQTDVCARTSLYDYYGRWLGTTNTWCLPCEMKK